MGDDRVIVTRVSEIEPEPMRRDWGPWHLDRDVFVLWIELSPRYRYEVDLEDCTTSAQVLDWICQVAGKQWDDPVRVIAGLVCALDDILNAQAHLCSSGRPKRLSRAQVRKLAEEAP